MRRGGGGSIYGMTILEGHLSCMSLTPYKRESATAALVIVQIAIIIGLAILSCLQRQLEEITLTTSVGTRIQTCMSQKSTVSNPGITSKRTYSMAHMR